VAELLKRPRILWANLYCLLDTSSGASMAVRQMLLQLQQIGWSVDVLGATVFDHERGTAGLLGHWNSLKSRVGKVTTVQDGRLQHRLFVTGSTQRGEVTNREEGAWFSLYEQALEQDKPDVVFYYGGQPFDGLIASEARRRGIAVVFYLVNGNYSKRRWAQDVSLVLTDSQATADLYRQRLNLAVTAVGAFIDPARVVAERHQPERVLFVNPLPAKGALWVVRLAIWLEQRRPDIVLEVVESRGKWSDMVCHVTATLGHERDVLTNVVVTPNTDDMRPIYGRARLLLAPSLWWESGARVLAEAMLNGIPAICTDRGGMPEMVQDGGILLRLADKYHERPYNLLPSEPEVAQLGECVLSLYDDQPSYEALARCARKVGRERHGLAANTARLVKALQDAVALH
jgi:glycosyltransferase involved in cell wall biosynthesis